VRAKMKRHKHPTAHSEALVWIALSRILLKRLA